MTLPHSSIQQSIAADLGSGMSTKAPWRMVGASIPDTLYMQMLYLPGRLQANKSAGTKWAQHDFSHAYTGMCFHTCNDHEPNGDRALGDESLSLSMGTSSGVGCRAVLTLCQSPKKREEVQARGLYPCLWYAQTFVMHAPRRRAKRASSEACGATLQPLLLAC